VQEDVRVSLSRLAQLYRVQPDPQFPPRLGDHIAFNGADFAATKRPFNSLQDLAA
jgi:hypothetical protein